MSLKGLFPIEKWDFNSISIFTQLNEGELEALLLNSIEQKYKCGEKIFAEGEIPTGIFYIKTGRIKKYKVDNFNKEQIIYVAKAGELIGYHAVLAREEYPDSAVALEESKIVFIPSRDFFAALEKSPALSMNLLKTLSHEFAVLINGLSVFAHRPTRERVAITLLVLREKFKEAMPVSEPVAINMSRADIANMAGTTRENLIRILRQFKDEGILQTKGRKIWVVELARLVQVTNYT